MIALFPRWKIVSLRAFGCLQGLPLVECWKYSATIIPRLSSPSLVHTTPTAEPEYDEVFIARNGTSMDPRTVRYRIHKYYKEAGIKKKASVHTLRYTFSTHQIHNGLKMNQLKEVLGHRRMETTYKYVYLDRTNLRQEMEQGAL